MACYDLDRFRAFVASEGFADVYDVPAGEREAGKRQARDADLMGITRDDLAYDLGRHVDESVHLFEEWGLPIWKTDAEGVRHDGAESLREGIPALKDGGKPVRTFLDHKDYTTAIDINPHYITPKMLQFRLQKIMDEYVAGCATYYKKHIQFREESRYPGFYYRTDKNFVDEKNWHCFVNLFYDKSAKKWTCFKRKHVDLVDKSIRFFCHRGIACWNACCSNIDISLTPYNILRLKRRLGISSTEFLERYTLVKDPHCLGHDAPREITIADYRSEQGLPEYDELARGWWQLILKKKSSGPTIGKPSKRSLQFFFMACYDVDRFREFVVSEGFAELFDIPAAEMETVVNDDTELMQFGFRFLRQTLFGEVTIPIRVDTAERRRARYAERQARLERDTAERLAREEEGDIGFN